MEAANSSMYLIQQHSGSKIRCLNGETEGEGNLSDSSSNDSCSVNRSIALQAMSGLTSENSQAELTGWCLVFSITSVMIIITNALTIKIFRINTQLRKKKENSLLLSLAIADSIVGATGAPLNIILLKMHWAGENYTVQYIVLTAVFLTIDVFSGFASVFTLTAIALERLFSVIKPQRHRRTSKRTYWYLVRVPWGASAVLSLIYALSYEEVLPFGIMFQFIVLAMIISFLVIVICYFVIWISIKSETQIRRTTSRNRRSDYQVRKEKKLTYVVVIVTVTFAITWLPIQIINIVFYVCHVNGCTPNISYSLINLFKLLQYSNSLLDPLIYALNIVEFRNCLRKTLLSWFHMHYHA